MDLRTIINHESNSRTLPTIKNRLVTVSQRSQSQSHQPPCLPICTRVFSNSLSVCHLLLVKLVPSYSRPDVARATVLYNGLPPAGQYHLPGNSTHATPILSFFSFTYVNRAYIIFETIIRWAHCQSRLQCEPDPKKGQCSPTFQGWKMQGNLHRDAQNLK